MILINVARHKQTEKELQLNRLKQTQARIVSRLMVLDTLINLREKHPGVC